MQNTLQFTKPFATRTFATTPSAPLLLALALGGHAPEVRDEAEIREFLDDPEAQEFLVSIGLGLEEYNQWRGNSPHFVAEFTRFSNDIHSRRGSHDAARVLTTRRGFSRRGAGSHDAARVLTTRRGCHFRAATSPTPS
jgi:hypothetical protein